MNTTVLEPSAGDGKLVNELVKQRCCTVDAIELNNRLFKKLQSTEVRKAEQADFLQIRPLIYYDYVVAVPPYKDSIDCEHIMHMYKFIKLRGKVVTLTLPYWMTGHMSIHSKFRQWLNTVYYTIKFIEDKSYAQCPKALLVIQK